MESKENMMMILQIIKNGKLQSEFISRYLTRDEIGQLLYEALTKEYIQNVYNRYVITELGIKYIQDVNNELKRKGIDRSICRLTKYEIPKINEEEVYLPEEF